MPMNRKTTVAIHNEHFLINGQLTYAGRTWNGHKIEGLLMNSRMVQGIFDDRNPQTRSRWNYPDGPWDPDRNTREFVAAMPEWRRHGLLGFTINLQGGSPLGYSKEQPWMNSAFNYEDGSLRDDYMQRLTLILDRADELGMVPILGYFYFGQEPRMKSEESVRRAAGNATDWLIERGYTNVIIEIANECNINYKHEPIKPARAHELIRFVQQRSQGRIDAPAKRLLVSTSLSGGAIPQENIVEAADFVLLHGNGVGQPEKIGEMVRKVRALKIYRGQPILFNEDDHFNFDKPSNNMVEAVKAYAGWGYFDYRLKGEESFREGYQSVPVDWTINSDRKRGFFNLLKEMTGA
jgi:hypothetical protein